MVKFFLDQAEFISFVMENPLKDFPHDLLKKGHTGFNITDIHFDEIVPILKKILINFQFKNNNITSIRFIRIFRIFLYFFFI